MSKTVSRILLSDGTPHRVDAGSTLTIDTNQLVAFYPMEYAPRPMVDESKNGLDGRVNGASRVGGAAGSGLFFTASDRASVRARAALDMRRDEFTIAFFTKPDSTADGHILGKSDGTSGFRIEIEDKKIRCELKDQTGGTELYSNTRLTTGDMYFITLTRRVGGETQLFIDAREEAGGFAEYDLSNDRQLRLGATMRANGVRAMLDEVYIYHRALRQGEISNIYRKYTL